jgi:phosphate transport system substrate-binding protein
MFRGLVVLAAVMMCGWGGVLQAQSGRAPGYVAMRQAAGVIRVCGSPQMSDLLKLYETGFQKAQPGVRFEEDLQSTLTAVPCVSSGRGDIALLGREIWPEEVEVFRVARGREPRVIDVATGSYDVPKATFALMVFVSRENPIASLSTGQLERIFSASDSVKTWGELGLKGEWAGRPIHLYGFAVGNDKSRVFAQLIFRPGERWNAGLHEFENAGGVDAGQRILDEMDRDGIAISNVHYASAKVKALALGTAGHAAAIAPAKENVASRVYPLTRAVYMVFDDGASEAVREFLRYVLSGDGSEAVVREGNYLALPAGIAEKQLRAVWQLMVGTRRHH